MAEQNRSQPHLGEPSSASNCGNTKPHAPSLRDVGENLKSERHIERGQQPLEKPRVVGPDTSDSQRDPKFVTWDGPDDRENPKNWPGKKKWITMSIVSLFTLISPVSSTMVAPALPSISAELHITSAFVSQLILSIFILAYAIGPLFLGPLSETYGRAPVLQLANLFYLAFNIGSHTVGGGVLGDTFPAEKRGTAMAIYSLAPLLGPSIGPIFGGFIAENTTWRWVFYATSIATGIMQVAGVLWLRETYAPQILYKRAKKLRMTTGDPSHKTEEERKDKTLGKALQASLVRPFRLLATQPIIQVLALYMAYIYGLMYLMLSTFPTLWTDPNYYDESTGIGGLHYISLGLGAFLGAYLCAFLNDRIFKRLSVRNNDQGKPEYRLPLLSIVTVCVPAGLFIYGWTAQTHAHWIAPNVGACVFAVGNMMTFQCMQTYIVDTYTQYAASAMAAVSVLRCLAAFGFPLFAPYMYDALSYGWGNSVLAFISLGIGIPAPIFLWKFGERLRKASPYAAEKTEGN